VRYHVLHILHRITSHIPIIICPCCTALYSAVLSYTTRHCTAPLPLFSSVSTSVRTTLLTVLPIKRQIIFFSNESSWNRSASTYRGEEGRGRRERIRWRSEDRVRGRERNERRKRRWSAGTRERERIRLAEGSGVVSTFSVCALHSSCGGTLERVRTSTLLLPHSILSPLQLEVTSPLHTHTHTFPSSSFPQYDILNIFIPPPPPLSLSQPVSPTTLTSSLGAGSFMAFVTATLLLSRASLSFNLAWSSLLPCFTSPPPSQLFIRVPSFLQVNKCVRVRVW
jgi:hypothetical protein